MEPVNVWKFYGMGMSEYRVLPWKKKRKLIYQAGGMTWGQYYFPTLPKWWLNIKLWWNRPPGGYLFQAWCRHNAEVNIGKGSPPSSWYDPPEFKLPKRRSDYAE